MALQQYNKFPFFFSGILGPTRLNGLQTPPIQTMVRWGHQYAPRSIRNQKAQKGRVPVPIGGSLRGTQLEWGEYGMRLKDRSIRFHAKQLETAEQILKRILKPIKAARVYTRFCCNVPVCVKGNETRMGKGKGAFEYWAARIPIGRVLFEIGGDGMRKELAEHALKQAAFHLPGKYEIIVKQTPKRLGTTLIHETPITTETSKMNYQEITSTTTAV